MYGRLLMLLFNHLLTFIASSGLFGTFIQRVIDRGLLPFGMHHLINFPLLYSPIGGTMVIDGVGILRNSKY